MLAAPGALWVCWMVQPVIATSAIEPPVESRKMLAEGGPFSSWLAYIAGADVQIADFAADSDDASAKVVADMAAEDVGLVEIDLIEEDPDSAITVEMAVGDDHVAIAFGEVDGVTTLADGQAREG